MMHLPLDVVCAALKTIHWGVTLAIGYVATNKRFKEFLESFGGTTIIGADLFISSMTMVIINMMMMYDHYADTKLASAYNKQLLGYAAAGATYTLAFIGITVQVGMKLPTIEHEIQDPKAPGGKMMLNIDGYEYPDLKDVPLKVHEDTTKGYPIRNLEGKTLTLPAKATSIIFTQSLLRYVYWIMNFVEDVIEELLKVKHGQEATISIPGMPKALVKILTSSLKSGELNSESITDILTLANDGAEDIPKTAENLFHKSTEYAKEQGRKQEESVKTKVAETTDKKTGEGKAKIAKVWSLFNEVIYPTTSKPIGLKCAIVGCGALLASTTNTTNARQHLSHVHKYHLAELEAEEYVTENSGGADAAAASTVNTVQAVISHGGASWPPGKRDTLTKKVVTWLCKRARPLSLPERDTALNDVLMFASEGGEILVRAVPFGEVAHTAIDIETATKKALALLGVGNYEGSVFVDPDDPDYLVDTVKDCLHKAVADGASNVQKGLGGIYLQWEWFPPQQKAIQMFHVESLQLNLSTDDSGSTYREFQLDLLDWQVIEQSLPVLRPVFHYTRIIQGTKYVTMSLLLPMTAWLIEFELSPSVDITLANNTIIEHKDLLPAVKEGRSAMHADVVKPWVTDL
eukprot:gene27577-34022_t